MDGWMDDEFRGGGEAAWWFVPTVYLRGGLCLSRALAGDAGPTMKRRGLIT